MGDPIKEMRGTDKTGTEDNQSGDKVVASIFKRALEEAKKNASLPVIKRSDYIDNALTTLKWNPILNTYFLEFKRGGKTYWVDVGADELGRLPLFEHPTMFTGWRRPTEVVTPYTYYDDFLGALYQSKKALGQAAKVNKAAAQATAFVSFYRETPERGSIIVPTHYTHATAPRLFRTLLQLHEERPISEDQRQAWLWVGEDFREGANKLVLNRIGIEMNKQGEYVSAGIPHLEENEQGEYELTGEHGLPKPPTNAPGTASNKGGKTGGKGSSTRRLSKQELAKLKDGLAKLAKVEVELGNSIGKRFAKISGYEACRRLFHDKLSDFARLTRHWPQHLAQKYVDEIQKLILRKVKDPKLAKEFRESFAANKVNSQLLNKLPEAIRKDIKSFVTERWNTIREAFWRNVYDDRELVAELKKIGMTFEKPGNAPVLEIGGHKIKITLDHISRKVENPLEAFDPKNLRALTSKDNSVAKEGLVKHIKDITDLNLDEFNALGREAEHIPKEFAKEFGILLDSLPYEDDLWHGMGDWASKPFTK